jgi:hypothetical protein
LELAPFGVSVITILPGVINTKLHSNNMARFDILPTSRYAAIKDTINGWAKGEAQPKDSLSAAKFAELVVSDVIGTDKGGLVSRGPYAALLRLVGQWAPKWVAVSSLIQGSTRVSFLPNNFNRTTSSFKTRALTSYLGKFL